MTGDLARLELTIPFRTKDEAEIAYNSLRVDREPKRSQVQKTLRVDVNKLIVELVGPDARSLKLSSNTFLDHLILVQKTIDTFSLDKYNVGASSSSSAKKPCLSSN